MNTTVERRIERLEALLPPGGPHEHDLVREYQLGEPLPPDGAFDAYLDAHHRPCSCTTPLRPISLFWDGVRYWSADEWDALRRAS